MALEKNGMTLVAVGQNHAFYDAFAEETLTVGDTAVGPDIELLKTGDPASGFEFARACTLFLRSGAGGDEANDAIMMKYIGTNPTSTTGAKIPVSMGYYRIEGPENIQHLKLIKAEGTSVPVVVYLVYEK